MSFPALREALKLYGRNSNSFLGLYPGFRYFRSRGAQGEITIAYVETPRAWIAAAEPLATMSDLPAAFREFAAEAQARGRRVLFIPTDGRTAEIARSAGYGAIVIGSEPTFQLSKYRGGPELVPAAKQLRRRGYVVQEFRPEALSAPDRAELDRIQEEWLASRKMVTLSFLNTVAPFALSEDKRYFLLRSEDHKPVCFLAAIPIWPRDAWYFIDLLRPDGVLPGSTELLVFESMRILKEQGAQEVTLGVAPLSNLPETRGSSHPRLYALLSLVYRKGNLFYNFQPLHQFKLKFRPTSEEPSYLLHYPADFGFWIPRDLFTAFLPRGFIHATLAGIIRGYNRLRFADAIRALLSPRLVLRSVPVDLRLALSRCRLTSALVVAQIAIFLASADNTGRIRAGLAERFSFIPRQPFQLSTLVAPGFLHWNAVHLASNLAALLSAGGVVEILAGSTLLFTSFLAGTLLANPLTAVLIVWPISWAIPAWGSIFLTEPDLGASLGIFAAIGAAGRMFRGGVPFLTLIAGAVILYCIGTRSLLASNHIAALVIGYLVALVLLERPRLR